MIGGMSPTRWPRRGHRSALTVVGVTLLCALALTTAINPIALGAKRSAPQAIRIHGPLRTSGGKVIDAKGVPVRFLGVGIIDLSPGRGLSSAQTGDSCNGWTSPRVRVYNNIRDWGFNSVRLAITWANLEPQPPIRVGPVEFHQWNRQYLRAIDEAVRRLTQRGIAVILEMAQNGWSPAFERARYPNCPGRGFPAWLYEGTSIDTISEAKKAFFLNKDEVQDLYATAWQVVAKRYANRALVVGADMMNEPFTDPEDMTAAETNLEGMYEKLGRAIREVNPRILLIFQDNQVRWKTDLAPRTPPPFDNVVYEMHLYAYKWDLDEGKGRMTRSYKAARHWNVPMYMGEFNAFGAGRNNASVAGPDWRRSLKSLMDYCKANRISWTYWAYWGSSSLIVPGTQQPKEDLLAALQAGF
jgi:hypothetical protein